MTTSSRDRVRKSLANHPLFRTFSDGQLNDLALSSQLRKVASGETLFSKGTSVEHAFLVLSGRFKISVVGPRGNELLLSLTEPGDIAGFVAPVDRDERFVSAIAIRNSEVAAIDRDDLMPILEANPKAMITLLGMMTESLRAAVAITLDVGLLDSQGRLWSRLMTLSERYGRPQSENGSLRIDHGLSQEDLASSIGMTRVVVNRTLRVWREQGLIETGRGYIKLLNPDHLKRFVVGSPSEP